MNEYMNADTREKIIILRAIKRLNEQFNQANKDDYVHELGNICEAFLYFFAELSDENKRFCEEAMNEISNVDLNKIREISLDLKDEKEKNGLNTDDDYEKVTDWIEKWINSLYESTNMKTCNKYIKEFKENIQKLEETPYASFDYFDDNDDQKQKIYSYQYDQDIIKTLHEATKLLNKIAKLEDFIPSRDKNDFNKDAERVAGYCVDLINELFENYDFKKVLPTWIKELKGDTKKYISKNFKWDSTTEKPALNKLIRRDKKLDSYEEK